MRILVLLALAACQATVTEPTDGIGPAPVAAPEATPAPAPDLAPGTEAVTLFGGRSGAATRYSAPAADTLEYAIIESLTLLANDDQAAWMDKYCHADACGDERMRESMTSHVLPAAKSAASTCLHDGDLLVTKQEEENGFSKTWIYCGESRMPAPSTAQQVDGAWRFSSISW